MTGSYTKDEPKFRGAVMVMVSNISMNVRSFTKVTSLYNAHFRLFTAARALPSTMLRLWVIASSIAFDLTIVACFTAGMPLRPSPPMAMHRS